MTAGSFDRLKPRAAEDRRPGAGGRPDREGKGVLFSGGDPVGGPALLGPYGALTVTCSACAATTALTPLAALRASLPSLHLPVVRRGFPSWMRCPSCARRTWVRVGRRPV